MSLTPGSLGWSSDDGEVAIWEYNVESDTDYPSGKLPVEGFPYSIHYAHGYLFVGYRDAPAHDQEGEAHLYYQRGGQGATLVRSGLRRRWCRTRCSWGMICDDLVFMVTGAGLFDMTCRRARFIRSRRLRRLRPPMWTFGRTCLHRTLRRIM